MNGRPRLVAVALMGVAALSCDGGGTELQVYLRTDLVASRDFSQIDVELGPSAGSGADRRRSLPADEAASYADSVRIAAYDDLGGGTYHVTVALSDAEGATVAERTVTLELEASRDVTVLVTRSCAGVECPGAGDDPSQTQCIGGVCQRARCSPEAPEACESQCAEDADCATSSLPACVRCSEGLCWTFEDLDACSPSTESDAGP